MMIMTMMGHCVVLLVVMNQIMVAVVVTVTSKRGCDSDYGNQQ